MIRVGTSYFTSRQAAIRYYRCYGGETDDVAVLVEEKIAEGEIHIGTPTHLLKPGDKLTVIDDGTRYAIIEKDSGDD